MKIIEIPDVHFKNDSENKKEAVVYNNGLFKAMDWLYAKYKDDILIFGGDLFDNSNPSNIIREKVTRSLMRFKKVYIMMGNHDFHPIPGNVLLSLGLHSNIEMISTVKNININGLDILFLPHHPIFNERKKYESLTNEDCHYTIMHAQPYQETFGSEEVKRKTSVELKLKPKVAHIFNHIHRHREFVDNFGNNVLISGILQTTREGEQEWPNFVYELNKDGYVKIEVPEFFNIKTIHFETEINSLSKDYLYNIENSPSKISAIEKFKGYYIRKSGIKVVKDMSKSISMVSGKFDLFAYKPLLLECATEKNVSNNVLEYSLLKLEEVNF